MHHGVQKFGSDSACRLPFLHHYKSEGVSLLRSSCPRVVLPIIFSRLVVADMGVYLGCSDLGMPQKVLNDTKVGASLEAGAWRSCASASGVSVEEYRGPSPFA